MPVSDGNCEHDHHLLLPQKMKILHEEQYKIVVPSSFQSEKIVDAIESEIPRALFYINNFEAYLLQLYVPPFLRNCGHGKQMLFDVATECLKHGCVTIHLDDMSDRFRKKNNIYIRCGFRYNKTIGPEMYSDPLLVCEKLKK